MNVIILLLCVSLSVAAVFLGAFVWSVRHRQYDDRFSPPRRILFDEPLTFPEEDPLTNNKN